MINQEELKSAILKVVDGGNNKTILENEALKVLNINDEKVVYVEIYTATVPNSDEEMKFKADLVKTVKVDFEYPGFKYKFIPMQQKGSIAEKDIKFLLIASGKGGVGKSNVTVNLAAALNRAGKKVGIIDADIYGASIPNVLGLDDPDVYSDEDGKTVPLRYEGMEIISTAFFIDKGKPLMWRGPMLGKMLEHFFSNVIWSNDIEYILIDLPPGTGDIAIDLGRKVPNGKMIVVTTPHKDASSIAIKAGVGAKQMGMEIMGVIENMSYFINPVNQAKEYIFGEGGGEEVAKNLGVQLMMQIPISMPKKAIYDSKEENGKIYDKLAKKIATTWLQF